MAFFRFVDGQYIAEPPRAAVRAVLPSSFERLRALTARHRREGGDIRAALHRVRAACRAWRPPVVHSCPSSTPRPRESGARVGAASGRDSTAGRDDGGGGGDSDGGDPPPRSSGGDHVLERGREP